MFKYKTLAAAILSSVVASSASAAVVQIESIAGIWTSVSPNNTVNLDGVGTSSIHWGTELNSTDSLSGYDFIAAGVPIVATEGVNFNLGDFIHNNFTIASSPTPSTITDAILQVTFDFTIDSSPLQQVISSYAFAHNETPNGATPCANGGANGSGANVNGCADIVSVTLNAGQTQSFDIDGEEYIFTIDGFEQGGTPLSVFETIENQSNAAQLVANYTTVTAPVPLPAAGWMLIAALGGLVAAKRKSKAAA